MTVAIVLLVMMSAYFSATETAFSCLNKIRMKSRAESGDHRAALAMDLVEDYDRLISTILIGNNIVNITASTVGTVLFTKLYAAYGPTVSTVVLTLVVLIFGEISPKSLAKEHAESFAMFSAPILRVFLLVLRPLNFLFSQWKRLLNMIFHPSEDQGITEEELITMVSEAENEGGLDQHESQLIRSAIEFGDLEAGDILTPRVDIVAVEDSASMEEILQGAFGSIRNFGNTLRWITPCILTGIAATIAFKSGVMNLGIEGQLYFGAYAAALFGFYVHLPKALHVTGCLLAAGIAGMLFALIPAVMKLTFHVNEMITTLMLNYIAVLLTEYFTYIVMGISAAGDSLALSTPPIADTARLTNLIPKTNASTGVLIAVALVIVIFMVYRYTVIGYELKQVGENRRFARIGGVNVTKTFLAIFLLSGFVAGLCGSIEVQGTYGKFTASFSNNLGWDGIMIAMIAGNHPITVLGVAVIWGILKAGSLHMERMCDVNRLTVLLIQALFVLFITVDYRKLFGAVKRKAVVA